MAAQALEGTQGPDSVRHWLWFLMSSRAWTYCTRVRSFPDRLVRLNKVQQLVLVRHPNFLNVLDVISDQSSDFVITERSRGQSIADLLKERPRLDLEDVLRLLTPLAGALDLAATYSCCANAISTCWLFTEMSSSFALDSRKAVKEGKSATLPKLTVDASVEAKSGASFN